MMNTPMPFAGENSPMGWDLGPKPIGNQTYRCGSEFVEVVDITYQQKAHTSGYTNGVRGFTYAGYGLVGGGEGTVSTTHENVATVIIRDQNGRERQCEFPAELAARNTALLRLDTVGNNIVAVRNISGKSGPIALLNEHDFYPARRLRKTFLFLASIGWFFFSQIDWSLYGIAVGGLMATPLAIWIFRAIKSSKNRKEMKDLIRLVISTPHANEFSRTNVELENTLGHHAKL